MPTLVTHCRLALSILLAGLFAAIPAAAADPEIAGSGDQLPWNLPALAAPPHFGDAPISEAGVRGIFFDGLPWKGKPTQVFAWLGLPKVAAGEKVPGMVLVHGGGGTAHAHWVRMWNERGYAAIAMDTCGNGLAANEPHQKRLEDGGPPGWDASFTQTELPIEDQWTYHAIADIVLAHSLLRSLPEVDVERIGLTGISWGGYLTCIAAGVDGRFKFAAPVYGCGFLGDDSHWVPQFEKIGPAAKKWLTLWDPSVYLPRARMPMLWVTGDADFAYPLSSLERSYRLPPGERYLAIRHAMPHGHPAGETPPEIPVLAGQLFAHGVPLARMTTQGMEDRQAWAQFAARAPLVKAQLVATADQGPWQKRQWTVVDADLDKASARVSAPVAAGTRAFYFILFDERGCVAASEHVECEP